MKSTIARTAGVLICLAVLEGAKLPKYAPSPEIEVALDRISPDSLRGHLSFIASDALEGRGTPSRGLDIAAEYIAAQFRRAGLVPAVNGDYFQRADMIAKRPNLDGFRVELTNGDRTVQLDAAEVDLETSAAVDLQSTPVFKLSAGDTHKPDALDTKV